MELTAPPSSPSPPPASQQFGSSNDSTTADVSLQPAPPDWASYPLYFVVLYLSRVYLPLIFLLGTFGNLMTIIITRRMASDSSTITMYYTAIAIADTIFLPMITLPWWFRQVASYDIRAAHSVLCKLHTFLYTSTATISCWCVVSMTVHRAMSVVWPHKVSVLCTRRTVLLVLIGMAVFFAALYSHYLVGTDRVPRQNKAGFLCVETGEGYKLFVSKVFVYIDMTVYSLLPFLILLASNAVLIWKLNASIKAAGKHLAQGDAEQMEAREKAANSVTRTVIAVSVSFIVLTLPNAIFSILNHSAMINVALNFVSRQEFLKLIVTNDVCVLLGISNGGVNFYLYCLTGKKFRKEFFKIVCFWKKG